jgi:hypothetical protein
MCSECFGKVWGCFGDISECLGSAQGCGTQHVNNNIKNENNIGVLVCFLYKKMPPLSGFKYVCLLGAQGLNMHGCKRIVGDGLGRLGMFGDVLGMLAECFGMF